MNCLHKRDTPVISHRRVPDLMGYIYEFVEEEKYLISCVYYWHHPFRELDDLTEYHMLTSDMRGTPYYTRNFPYDFDYRFHCDENCKHYKE